MNVKLVPTLPEPNPRSPIPMHLRLIKWFCGFQDGEKAKKHHRDLAEHLDAITNLEQSRAQRTILLANLAVILAGALLLYVCFSINPFTADEIDELRERALENATVVVVAVTG